MLDTNAVPNDYAAVNQGQAKWMAVQAAAELDRLLPGGMGSSISNMIAGFTSGTNDLPLNLGQMKHLAAPFYDRIRAEGFTNALPPGLVGVYPWTDAPSDDNDFAIANIGQLKRVFSFDLELCFDADNDGLSDGMEHRYGSNLQSGDSDGDGLGDADEVYIHGTSPARADTDGDGLSDPAEINWRGVAAWGLNNSGQCDVPAALSNVAAVAAGYDFVLALRSDGGVTAWGRNDIGQCDVPAAVSEAIAIAAGYQHALALGSDGVPVVWGGDWYEMHTPPPEAVNVTALAAGGGHALALRDDGLVLAWGGNPAGVCDVPVGLADVTAVSAGGDHSVALRSDGTVVTWGENWSTQGIAYAEMTGVVAVASGQHHALVLLADGSVSWWGSPEVEIPSGITGAVAVAAGTCHSLALLNDGSISLWGADREGECTVPEGLQRAFAISAGHDFSVAVVALNPANADTDGDGLPDGWEARYGLNPCGTSDSSRDDDLDGLTLAQELAAGSDPGKLDTDDDGMDDAWEVTNGLNPADPADADALSTHPLAHGLTNLQVFRYPGVLVAPDHSTAGDGIPDWWKASLGLNANDSSLAAGDTDGDGYTLKAEYDRQSHPGHDDRVAFLIDTSAFSLNWNGFDTFVETTPRVKYSTLIQAWDAAITNGQGLDHVSGGSTVVRDRRTGEDTVTRWGTPVPTQIGRAHV